MMYKTYERIREREHDRKSLPRHLLSRACAKALPACFSLWLGLAIPAHGQWAFDPAASIIDLESSAETICVSACGPTPGPLGVYEPGFGGDDITYFTEALCKVGTTSTCGCKARGWALIGLRGLGSGALRIRAEGYSYVKHRCDYSIAYHAEAIGDVELAELALSILGLPPGATVTVFYSGEGYSWGTHNPEGTGDDWTVVGLPSTYIDVAGEVVLPLGDLDLPYVPGAKHREWEGAVVTGPDVPVTITGGTWAVINPPPKSFGGVPPWQYYYEWDTEFCGFSYVLNLSVGSPPPPPPPDPPQTSICEGDPHPLFSLDIASATEPSDPTPATGPDFPPGAEPNFDAGDMYEWLVSLPDTDGEVNDEVIVGPPALPDVPMVGPAPACAGIAIEGLIPGFFDLDGHASADFSIADLFASVATTGSGALLAPIPEFASTCVYPVEHLIISFEDDRQLPYSEIGFDGTCSTPVSDASPAGQTYGSEMRDDEVLGVELVSLPFDIVPITYPVASETDVHGALGLAPPPPPPPLPPPGPPPTPQDEDDDVDALDMKYDGCGCTFDYFGGDREALYTLDSAGVVYEASPGGPIAVIDPVAHLGLTPDVDLRDFDFGFVESPFDPGSRVFAIIFAVSGDDISSFGIDESGGLNPRVIYWSAFTGVSFPLFMPEYELDDDIDALAITIEPMRKLYACAVGGPAGPANDCCDSPTAVAVGTSVAYSTAAATSDGQPMNAACGSPGKDIWYILSAPANGLLNVYTCDAGTTYDTTLAIYDVNDGAYDCQAIYDGSYLAGCDDDGCSAASGASTVTVHARAGRSYLVQVGGSGGASGSGVVHFDFTPMDTLFYTGRPRAVMNAGTLTNLGWSSGNLNAANPQRWSAQAFTLPSSPGVSSWHVTRIEADGFTPEGALNEELAYIIWSRTGLDAPADGDQVAAGAVAFPAGQDDQNMLGADTRLHALDGLDIDLPPGDYWLTLYAANSSGGATPSNFAWFTNAAHGINVVDGGGAFMWRSATFPAPGFLAYTLATMSVAEAVGGDPDDLYNAAFRILGEPGTLCLGDIAPVGGNGTVNIDDLFAVIAAWGACPMPCPPSGGCAADVDGDCDVDIDDLFTVIAAWGPCM